jgi:hypothetical protein
MTFRPVDYCVNCQKEYQYHVDGKCPFEASTFKKREGFLSYTEQGVGIGNIAAIQKIQFFDVSVVSTPYIPAVEDVEREILTAFAIPAEMLNGEQSTRKEPHEPVDDEPEGLGRSHT